MNSLRMICRTFMDWLAQSMRFFPMSARSRFLTSQLICVGVVDIPLLISMMTVKFWAPASQLDDQNTRNVGRDFSRTSLYRELPWDVAKRPRFVLKKLPLRGLQSRFAQPSFAGQLGSLIRGFPREVLVSASEMAVRSRLAINRTPQVQRIDNALRSQLEVRPDQVGNDRRIDLGSPERFNQNTHRFGDADRIRQLNFALIGETRRDNVFGNVTRHVGRGPIHLGRIFAAESAAAMASHAAVGVHDDLATGQTGVAHRAADHKSPRGVEMILAVRVE